MKIAATRPLLILLLLTLSFFCNAVLAGAEKTNDEILLWPADAAGRNSAGMGTPKPDRGDGHIRLTDIEIPSMEYFPTPHSGEPVPLVILCPGGGYGHLVVTKMAAIAEWLNGHGISACVLRYHTPKRREDAFQDIQRAIRIVRSRSAEWNVDPQRIGVMGSSAGGHLAARAAASYKTASYQPVDEIDEESSRPDFSVLLYPAYMETGKALSPEFTVSRDIGPTLIISAMDDKAHFPGSPVYAAALEDAGASVRVHFFEKGGHGFGLHPEEEPLSTWPDLYLQWLKDIGILEKSATPADEPEGE